MSGQGIMIYSNDGRRLKGETMFLLVFRVGVKMLY